MRIRFRFVAPGDEASANTSGSGGSDAADGVFLRSMVAAEVQFRYLKNFVGCEPACALASQLLEPHSAEALLNLGRCALKGLFPGNAAGKSATTLESRALWREMDTHNRDFKILIVKFPALFSLFQVIRPPFSLSRPDFSEFAEFFFGSWWIS